MENTRTCIRSFIDFDQLNFHRQNILPINKRRTSHHNIILRINKGRILHHYNILP